VYLKGEKSSSCFQFFLSPESFVDTGAIFTTGVLDTRGNFIVGVKDTSDKLYRKLKFMAGVLDIGHKLIPGVKYPSDKLTTGSEISN